MRLVKLTTIIAIGTLLILSVPAFADTFTVFNNPGDGNYMAATTNYGGGDGSLNFITSLGPFTFSNPQSENNVPNSWATWNCPPFTESCTPNVLYNEGFTTLHIDIAGQNNVIGWELEPDQFQVETFSVTYNTNTGDHFTVMRDVNGSAGALLFAVEDTTPGSFITSADISNTAGDDFATAQWRAGSSGGGGTTPEPGSILLFGSGILGLAGVLRRKINL